MKNSPIKIIVIITLIVAALIVALLVLNNNTSESEFESNPEEPVGQPPIDGQPTLGESDAPVTVVEFGDFKCPACKVWGEDCFRN